MTGQNTSAWLPRYEHTQLTPILEIAKPIAPGEALFLFSFAGGWVGRILMAWAHGIFLPPWTGQPIIARNFDLQRVNLQ